MRLKILVLVAAAFLANVGCKQDAPTPPRITARISISGLLKSLKNFELLGIESCTYLELNENPSSRTSLPSPSDKRLEVSGSALLKPDGYIALRTNFSWKPVERGRIPFALSSIVPVGNVLSSETFNRTFESNAVYANGFAIVMDDDASRTIYFVASDRDHAIQLEGPTK